MSINGSLHVFLKNGIKLPKWWNNREMNENCDSEIDSIILILNDCCNFNIYNEYNEYTFKNKLIGSSTLFKYYLDVIYISFDSDKNDSYVSLDICLCEADTNKKIGIQFMSYPIELPPIIQFYDI